MNNKLDQASQRNKRNQLRFASSEQEAFGTRNTIDTVDYEAINRREKAFMPVYVAVTLIVLAVLVSSGNL
jgi:hypothetical protein